MVILSSIAAFVAVLKTGLATAGHTNPNMLALASDTYPVNVLWDITGACNLDCAHCCATESAPRSSLDLPFEDVSTVVRNLASPRPVHLTFSGGEPFLRPDFPAILDLTTAAFPRCRIAAFTNGTQLGAIGTALLARKVEIRVSLEGVTPHAHDGIRGRGTFDCVVRGLSRLPASSDVAISYTLTTETSLPSDILDFCSAHGIRKLVVTRLASLGKGRTCSSLAPSDAMAFLFAESLLVAGKSRPRISIFVDYVTPLFVKYVNCQHGMALPYRYRGCKACTAELLIQMDGTALPCRFLTPRTEVGKLLGVVPFDLRTGSIDQCLQQSAWLRIRDLKNSGPYPTYQPCCACEFAGRYCDPCWIQGHLGQPAEKGLCEIARERLEQCQR